MTNQGGPTTSPSGTFIVSVRPLFPRRHASVNTALWLGTAAMLGCGPIAGVPAILLGRLVLREIADSPRLFHGQNSGTSAIALGSVGTCLYSAIGLAYIAQSDSSLERAFAIFGALLLVVLAMSMVAQSLRRWPVVVAGAAASATLLAGALIAATQRGLVEARELKEAQQECLREVQRAQTALVETDFSKARIHQRAAEPPCKRASDASAATLQTQISREESVELEKRRLEEKAHEEAAAERFTREAPELREQVAKANALANQAKWQEAWDVLARAQDRLARYADTKVESTDSWRALSAEVFAARPRIAKPLEAIETAQRKAEAARQDREQAQAEVRSRAATRSVGASSGSSTVLCCDGTRSPSCGCDRSSFRGCCSHHGGICGGCDSYAVGFRHWDVVHRLIRTWSATRATCGQMTTAEGAVAGVLDHLEPQPCRALTIAERSCGKIRS